MQYGTSWSRISKALKGRTSQQCRARWHQLQTSRSKGSSTDVEQVRQPNFSLHVTTMVIAYVNGIGRCVLPYTSLFADSDVNTAVVANTLLMPAITLSAAHRRQFDCTRQAMAMMLVVSLRVELSAVLIHKRSVVLAHTLHTVVRMTQISTTQRKRMTTMSHMMRSMTNNQNQTGSISQTGTAGGVRQLCR